MLPPRVDRVKQKLCVLWGYFYVKKEQSLLHKKIRRLLVETANKN